VVLRTLAPQLPRLLPAPGAAASAQLTWSAVEDPLLS